MAELISEICTAIQHKDFPKVDTLLSQLKDSPIDISNQNDIVVFYVASMSGNVDLLKKFIESGFPVNNALRIIPEAWSVLQNYLGYTGLHFAFEHHRLNAIQFLLNIGANVFIPDDKGITPLHVLFKTKVQKQDSLETYDQIIIMILQTNQQENYGVTHFHIACTRDDPIIIANFLQNGACINETVGTFSEHEGFSPLHFAVKYNCVQVVKFLLKHGANVNQVSRNNMAALHLADLPEIVGLLLQHGADITLQDVDVNTPLHKAFEARNFKIMDMLLSVHLNINANPTNAVGISHFHIACTRNNEDIVKEFLKNGASVNCCVPIDPSIEYASYSDDIDWRGCLPLHFAAAFNASKIVELLLSDKADVKIQDARGFTALHMACRSLHEKYEELIMNSLQTLKDANVVGHKYRTKSNKFFDIQNAMGSMLVSDMFKPKPKVIDWTSNSKDYLDIVKMLLQHKSDVNCHDKFANTPLFYAYVYYALDDSIFHGKYQQPARDNFLWEMYKRRKLIMKMLLRHPVNLDRCYQNGSILHFMVEESLVESISSLDELELLEKFLKKGLTVDVLNDKMLTPLFILVQRTDRTDFISLLIQYGANVNFHEPEKHSTPLHAVLENVYDKKQLILDELLRGGADPNAKRLNGTTVLHYLAGEFYYYPRIFERLMGAGAEIDARDAKGRTPLFRACLCWNDGLAEMLLENGADIKIEDNKGKTVFCVMYEEKLLAENISGQRYAEMVCSLFRVLLSHLPDRKESISDKLMSSHLKVIDYLTKNVDSSFGD